MSKTESSIQEFVTQFPVIHIHEGDVPFHHQESLSYLLYLMKGSIRMSQTTATGLNITLHIFYAGATVPLLSLNEDPERYEFEALSDIAAYKIPKITFIEFLHQHPEIMYEYFLRTLKGMDGLLFRIKQNVSVPAFLRVASLLLYFESHLGSKGEKSTIELLITHQDIANWLGLSRENVSIQMKKLENAGIIAKESHYITILKLDELEKLAEELN